MARKRAPKRPAAKIRTTSEHVATVPACKPLKDMYEAAVLARPTTWNELEEPFLRAMEAFDDNVVAGLTTWGDRQNGKGDFFNDVLALILEHCAEVTLYSRGQVPGLIIPRHNLDVTFPPEGIVEFMLEAKAVGVPKHPENPQAKPSGRPGAADLDKRVKEIGFKAIDLKGEYGRQMARKGEKVQMIGDLTQYLRQMKPTSFVFFSARVVSNSDLRRVIGFADVAAQVSDAVGVFAYRPVAVDKMTRYEPAPVAPHLQIDRVLHKACQELIRIKSLEPEAPTAEPGPAQEVLDVPLPEAEDDSGSGA